MKGSIAPLIDTYLLKDSEAPRVALEKDESGDSVIVCSRDAALGEESRESITSSVIRRLNDGDVLVLPLPGGLVVRSLRFRVDPQDSRRSVPTF